MSAPELDTLLSRLAVTGRFDPARLLRPVPDAQIDALAARLAEYCDEDLTGGRYRWILRASARRGALERLGSKSALRQALADAPAIDRGDRFGEMLRASLAGKLAPASGPVDPIAEEARQAALQFARHVPALGGRAIADALDDTRMRIALREREDALSIVLGRDSRLFGRRDELDRIRRFVEGRGRDARPLLVTGMGGIGKSTLLAAVIRGWTRRRGAPAVVLLDFDRPALSSGDPIEIVREFTRQLSFEWITSKTLPKTLRQDGHQILRDKRAQLIATYEAGGEVHRMHAESQFSMLSSLLFHPLLSELPAQLRKAPVVLAMDTFEVVGRQGPEVTRRVLDLEAALRQQAGFTRLRTIVSGRGIPLAEELAVQHFGAPGRWLALEGLEEEAAAAFLADRDRRRKFRSKATRVHAARVLKGHPLALLVLERYARQRSAAEVARLLRDVAGDPGFSAEFAQTFLYARILERIRDPEVRALAHPGLVLRYVTPGLIRLVLAAPCGIGAVSEAESEKLFEKLKGEYWLVDTIDARLVRHRADLRRLMLPGLFAGPRATDTDEVAERKRALRDAARAVCRAARDFYLDGPPAGDPARAYWEALTPRARLAEQFYHDGLAGGAPPSELSREVAADIRSELREDLDTMPAGWRAVVKAALDDALALSEEETATLSGDWRERVESARIDADLRHGETVRARERSRSARVRKRAEQGRVAHAGPPSAASAGRDELPLVEKEVLACFADADLEGVVKIGGRLIDALATATVTDVTTKNAAAGRLWDTALWKAVVASPWADPRFESAFDDLVVHKLDMPWSLVLLVAAGSRRIEFLASPKALEHTRQGQDRTRLFAARVARGLAPHGGDWLEIGAETLAVGSFAWLRPNRRKRDEPWAEWLRFGPKMTEFIEKPPVRSLTLEGLEILYRAGESATLGFGSDTQPGDLPGLLGSLRGLTPELHHPASRILRDLGKDVGEFLAVQLAGLSELWPRDLYFVGRNAPAYTERHALPLVETADRLGLLRTVLDDLSQRDPRGARLLAFHEAITERLFTPLVMTAAA